MDNPTEKEKIYRRKHKGQSNLFEAGRYATIRHLEKGIPLLKEMVSKHKIKYRLQFRFRPDKQTNINEDIAYDRLRHTFVDELKLDGNQFIKLRSDEFELISISNQLANAARIIPSEIMKIFEDLKEYFECPTQELDENPSLEADDILAALTVEEFYDRFEKLMKTNAAERKQRKERRKSEKYSWQFVDLDVKEIKKEMIYLNIAACSNFQVLNQENIWNYKLMCCVLDEDPDKWICIDKGRYRVDLDCVVPENKTVHIKSFRAMPRSRNRKKGFHGNVWVFRSLHLKARSTLTIEPFGYNFINKEEKSSEDDDEYEMAEIGDNPDFHFGSIRIFCYDELKIDEGATINVQGMGTFGTFGSEITHKINIGRGGRVDWIHPNDKRNKKGSNFNQAGAKSIYSGGGYGTKGKAVYDASGGKYYEIKWGENKILDDPDDEIIYSPKGKTKSKSKKPTQILSGGVIYGEKELDTLYYGSSGGKGIIETSEDIQFKKDNWRASDRGGGIIELIAQKIENHGLIIANGSAGRIGGLSSCGSGGSIKIKCREFKNGYMSRIEAKGGTLPGSNVDDTDSKIDNNYVPSHGTGGDGRIAIYFDKLLDEDNNDDLEYYIKEEKERAYINGIDETLHNIGNNSGVLCVKCKENAGVVKYAPTKGYKDNIKDRIWCKRCYKKVRQKPILCKMQHEIDPWPFVAITDECKKSKLPNWHRPRKNNNDNQYDQYNLNDI